MHCCARNIERLTRILNLRTNLQSVGCSLPYSSVLLERKFVSYSTSASSITTFFWSQEFLACVPRSHAGRWPRGDIERKAIG
jgi:hypothetical protein